MQSLHVFILLMKTGNLLEGMQDEQQYSEWRI